VMSNTERAKTLVSFFSPFHPFRSLIRESD
jgi:hypothetical protein